MSSLTHTSKVIDTRHLHRILESPAHSLARRLVAPYSLSVLMLGMTLALGTLMMLRLQRAEAEQRCVLLLHQDGVLSDSSGLVEAPPSDLEGSVDIVLNGTIVASATRGGFVHSFIPGKGANILRLKGNPGKTVEVRLVRLGLNGDENLVLWQKTVSPPKMKEGVACTFGVHGAKESSEGS